MIRIIDTFDKLPAFFPEGRFSMSAWNAYADSISPTLGQKCREDVVSYNFETEVLPVVETALAFSRQMEKAHASFCKVVDNLQSTVETRLHLSVEADIVLYLGLCSGAGWATELDGRPAVLLGLEKIVELDWTDENAMNGLILHELGHLIHFQTRKTPDFAKEAPALWHLYEEGMAMLFEQELLGKPDYFHQNKDGWLIWCEENRARLFVEYLHRVEAGESVQDFFGDWCSFEGHSDVGYYLGAYLCRNLLKNIPLTSLCDANAAQVMQMLKFTGGAA